MIKVFEVVECGGPGGTGEQVAAICNGLDPSRFDVGLIYAVRGGAPGDYRAQCRGAKTAFYVPEMTREISPVQDALALRRLYRLFADLRPDAVHAHSSKAGVLARVAAKAAGVQKIFYSPHGYGFLMQDRSRASRSLYRLIETGASKVGTTIAVSPSEAEAARRLGGRRVQTVCDAYLGDFAGPLPHDGTLVGSCGRMTFARDPDAWVHLVQRLTDSRNGVKCVWIGGGEDEARTRAHLANMNLTGKVDVTGWLAAAEARERLRGLDVFVHYSRWDAMPNAVLEAMALGLPVVASDIPGNRDAVVHGVTGLLAKSEAELLEHCQQLIDEPALRRRLGEAGRRRVQSEFSRERMLSELSRLYAS